MEDNFDFDKSYEELLEKAQSIGFDKDMVFQTTMKEYKRLKLLCDRMVEEIDSQPIADMQEGSKGNLQYKSNPVIKDYISGHKALVSTGITLSKMLEGVLTSSNTDDLFE